MNDCVKERRFSDVGESEGEIMCTVEFRSFKRSDGGQYLALEGQYGTNWFLYWQRKVGEKITLEKR